MWQKILTALAVVVTLIAMAAGGVFGRMFGDATFDFLASEKTTSALSATPGQMPLQRAGNLALKYSFPFVLNETESKSTMAALPPNARNVIHSLSIYGAKPACGLGEVRLVVMVYAPDIQVSVDGAAAGATQQISKLEGITSPEDSTVSTYVSGHPARRVSYKAKRWGGILGGEFLVVADLETKTFWQLQLMFSAKKTNDYSKLNSVRSCANEILASASIQPAP